MREIFVQYFADLFYLFDIRQIDGNANFKNKFCNCIQTVQRTDFITLK